MQTTSIQICNTVFRFAILLRPWAPVRLSLRSFYTVAKRLSFTKAAAALFITQPAVTKHIYELSSNMTISF
ncbi:hypothetical protein CS542_02755 [Pedobacter sp. IW39]|nr:hypothetical protein CS542_02755 [Pedobacter sp. IW39]